MNTSFSLTQRCAVCSAAALVAVALALSAVRSSAAESTANVSTNIYGSGKQFQTTVERRSQGDLSAEDLHQASLLTSQFLTHVNQAVQELADMHTDAARTDIEKALSLAKVVHGLLPTTVVTTTIKNAQGKEIYHHEQQVQDDQIPIFSGDVATEVVEPIIEARHDDAALKGVKLADAQIIHTAVLVDLNYAERKLKRAMELIAKPQEASAELALIRSDGVHFYAHQEDNPLVKVQQALRLAERMVREKKFEGAKANLVTAKLQLEAYRALVGADAGMTVSDLEKSIQKLSGELQTPGAGDQIRGMWDKVTGWFKRESGQAHQTMTNSVPSISSR
ncbi:MAG: YfdX family protein [Verrucomicrobiota bacterium]